MTEHTIYASKSAFKVMLSTYNFTDFCPSNIYIQCVIKRKSDLYLSGRYYGMKAEVINDDILLFMPKETSAACWIRVGRVWTNGSGVILHTETIVDRIEIEEDEYGEI